ncbi:hypothetical protein NX059_006896 [Plenodomus lindquistii]|nr:hypothetical protein NX059_006896 [Plenodomus lindquistii]
MKTFQLASIIALASVATAQLDLVPQCALQCFLGPLTSDGCSELTDFRCHCEKGATLIGSVQPCVQGACSPADQLTSLNSVKKICEDAGVPIELPEASEISAAPASSAAVAVSSAAPAATSAVASAASSAASAASSAVQVATSSLAGAVSSAVASATSASASASLPHFTGGAAAQATGAAVLIGAAAFAMLL